MTKADSRSSNIQKIVYYRCYRMIKKKLVASQGRFCGENVLGKFKVFGETKHNKTLP